MSQTEIDPYSIYDAISCQPLLSCDYLSSGFNYISAFNIAWKKKSNNLCIELISVDYLFGATSIVLPLDSFRFLHCSSSINTDSNLKLASALYIVLSIYSIVVGLSLLDFMTQIIIDLNFYIYKKLKPLSFFAPHYIFFALMLSLVGIQGIIPGT